MNFVEWKEIVLVIVTNGVLLSCFLYILKKWFSVKIETERDKQIEVYKAGLKELEHNNEAIRKLLTSRFNEKQALLERKTIEACETVLKDVFSDEVVRFYSVVHVLETQLETIPKEYHKKTIDESIMRFKLNLDNSRLIGNVHHMCVYLPQDIYIPYGALQAVTIQYYMKMTNFVVSSKYNKMTSSEHLSDLLIQALPNQTQEIQSCNGEYSKFVWPLRLQLFMQIKRYLASDIDMNRLKDSYAPLEQYLSEIARQEGNTTSTK